MNITLETLNLISGLKLIWVVFMILTWIAWQWRKTSGIAFITLFGIFLSSTYLLVAQSSQTMFWGMSGDESFIATIFNQQAWGSLGADLTSHALPLFYPPLYFIIGGIVGKLIHFNGIGIAKVMVTASLFAAPIIFYALLRFWHAKSITKDYAVLAVALLLTALPFDAIFLKPYEMLSGVSLVIIASGIAMAVWERRKLSKNQWIFAILTMGAIFCTFYFWFLLLAIAIAILLILGPKRKEMLITWVALGITTLALSSWYWLPNVMSFIKYGYENWQPLFFVKEDLNVFNPFSPVLSFLGTLVFSAALAVMIRNPKNQQIKILASLIASAYLYLCINFILFSLHLRPMQASKGFLFFAMPALILTAIVGIQKVAGEKYRPLIPIIIIIASIFTLPGIGIDQTRLKIQIENNSHYVFLRNPELNALFGIAGLKDKTLLTSGIPELEARAPYQEYVTHNINLAHPALGFTQRHDFVLKLAQSKNPQEFADLFAHAPRQSIDSMLLFHDTNEYHLYYWLDNFPNGGREEVVNFPRTLIDSKYFEIKKTSDEFDLILKK